MSELLSKSEMTDDDIKLRYITPAIERKWDKNTQMRMEYCFTDGRVIVRGNTVARGKRKKADYVLYYRRNLPLAIVEAKDNNHSVGAGSHIANRPVPRHQRSEKNYGSVRRQTEIPLCSQGIARSNIRGSVSL